jgi:hypothetical protein
MPISYTSIELLPRLARLWRVAVDKQVELSEISPCGRRYRFALVNYAGRQLTQ